MNKYNLYMEEYIAPLMEELGMCDVSDDEDYLIEDGEEATAKNPVYKVNYYLRDHLQNPYIRPILAKPKNQEDIIAYVGKFLDDHGNQLSTSGPIHMFTYGESETKFLYDLFGLNPQMLIDTYLKMIDESFYGKISLFITGWVKNSPHKLMITSMLIDAIQNNYEDIVTCCEYMWAFSEYPILYRNFWKTGVKEDVMNYTIEHLSTKFKVKKVNNLQGLLKYDAHASVAKMADRLKTGADNTYTDFMQRMRNQMKGTFKNIANAYYDNDKEDSSQHSKSNQYDDGTLADQEGLTTNITQVVDKTISKFSIGEVNNSIARIAADAAQVDKDNLTGFINQIYATKNNRLNKLVENIITSYFNKNPTVSDLSSPEFLNFGLILYRSIGTSKDPMYQEIKSILNYWIYEIINIKQFYQREATWSAYSRAVFNYVVLMINYYN